MVISLHVDLISGICSFLVHKTQKKKKQKKNKTKQNKRENEKILLFQWLQMCFAVNLTIHGDMLDFEA